MTHSDPPSPPLFPIVTGLVFLAFVAGIATHRYEWFSAQYVNQALDAGEAWWRTLTEPPYVGREEVEKTLTRSEFTWDKAHADDGYTLLTLRYSTGVYLIDMEGHVVYRWSMPFDKAWPNPSHVFYRNADRIYIEKALLFPNGDVLAIYTNSGDTPYGYGIAKMDKDSNVLWTYDARTHHDIYVDKEKGNVYTLIHRSANSSIEGLPAPVLEDFIVVLSPDGKELDRLSVAEAFHRSSFAPMLYHAPHNPDLWDHFHTNSIMKLEPETAPKFPMFEAGQVLISIRNMNALAVVDLKERKVVWAYNGLWRGQHSAEFLDNGRLLLFDNKGDVRNHAVASRLIELNPATLQVSWSYIGTPEQPFYTPFFGRVQRLSNGGTLATDAMNMRLFEVSREGHIVWDYRLPRIRLEFEPGAVPTRTVVCSDVCPETPEFPFADYLAITSATRYAKDSLPFLQKKTASQ